MNAFMEFKLSLEYLVEEANNLLSDKSIKEQLWTYGYKIECLFYDSKKNVEFFVEKKQ